MNATMTSHCANDRFERVQRIITEIGLGNIVQERLECSSNARFKFKYVCITNTGITVVKSQDKQKIITIYVTTINELVRVYNGRMNIPEELWDKVIYNQNRYVRNGKTIWR